MMTSALGGNRILHWALQPVSAVESGPRMLTKFHSFKDISLELIPGNVFCCGEYFGILANVLQKIKKKLEIMLF